MQLLKVGGNELDAPGFLEGLARTLVNMAEPVVVVHGGGQAIADLQARLGLETVKVDGLRVTDGDSLEVSQMVLSGGANKKIVAAMIAADLDAVGLSGVDGGLLRCLKKVHPQADLGFVGEIVEVRPEVIQGVMERGFTPVVSPISLGLDGQIYNVNADEAAGALAAALGVSMITFISNVAGILDSHGRPVPTLTAGQAQSWIDQGIIQGGMVPKVKAALAALDQGIAQVRILDLPGLSAGSGTLFVRETADEDTDHSPRSTSHSPSQEDS